MKIDSLKKYKDLDGNNNIKSDSDAFRHVQETSNPCLLYTKNYNTTLEDF